MAKILDDRMVDEVELISVSYKANVQRHVPIQDSTSGETEIIYVVLTRIVYWLLGAGGNKLKRVVVNHDLYPLPNPITSIQFINNLEVLAPLIKAAAIADRDSFTVAD